MQEKADEFDFFFKNISVRINKSLDQIQPFIKILKNNWYDTVDSLRGLTDEDYQKLNIPYRIFSAIREELALSSDNKPNLNTNAQQQKVQNLNNEKKQKPFVLNQKTLYTMVQTLKILLVPKLGMNDTLQILQILLKIIKNIVNDPYQLKFRTLKKSNKNIQKNIIEHQDCLNFMKNIGFVDNGEALELNVVQIPQLVFLQECLTSTIQSHGQKVQTKRQKKEENMFLNVTEFPKNQKQLNQNFSEEKLAEANYCDVLQKLVQFRNKMMADPPKNRRIRIYHKRHETKIVNVEQICFEKQFQKSDNQIIAKYWKQAVANNMKSQKFQSRRKQEFQYLIKQKVHKQTLIKIKLPNQFIIQAYFGPLEKLSQVFKVAAEIVIGDLYLFTAPPLKRMDKQMDKSLIQMESVPTGSFYLGVNTNYYIKSQYANIILK